MNVIALIGERGREVGEFVTEALGNDGLEKSVVIACTSDAAPMLRLKAPLTAVTIAEAFRAQGADALRGYLDGHIVLSRRIAERGKFPAIDVLASISRLMPKVTTPEHQKRARKLRELMAYYEENRDLVAVGAYRKGADPLLDQALGKIAAIEGLLFHGTDGRAAVDTQKALQQIAGG